MGAVVGVVGVVGFVYRSFLFAVVVLAIVGNEVFGIYFGIALYLNVNFLEFSIQKKGRGTTYAPAHFYETLTNLL